MKDLTPRKEDLDPIEIASRDEIAATQLERMKWSLKHAYENVPFYRKSFDDAGVHPDDLKTLHRQTGSARQLSVWTVCRPARADFAYPRKLGHHRSADRCGLYQE